MRILLVNSHGADTSVGGAERYVSDLTSGLARRGHAVSILAAFPGQAEAVTTTLHTTDWRTSKQRRLRNHAGDLVSRPTTAIAQALEEHRPEVVHTNNLPGVSTAVWEVARRQRLPVVHSLHDYYLLCPRVTLLGKDGTPCCAHPRFCARRAQRLGRWAAAVSDVVGVSHFVLERHRDVFPRARHHVIRHPVEPVTSLALPPPEELRTIGYIGALETTKGVHELLRAAEAIRSLGCELHLAGNGRLRPAVEEAAAEGRLTYHGSVAGARKSEFFAACDLGIVPSVWPEPGGPPYVVLEWLTAARPALVSSRGGLGERLDEFPGLIPTEPNAAGLVQSIERLRASDSFRAAVAQIRPVGTAGDGERWLDEHEAVYRCARAGAGALA